MQLDDARVSLTASLLCKVAAEKSSAAVIGMAFFL